MSTPLTAARVAIEGDRTNTYSEDRAWLKPEVANLAATIAKAGTTAGVHVIDIQPPFDNSGPHTTTSPYVTEPDFNLWHVATGGITTSSQDNWFDPPRPATRR